MTSGYLKLFYTGLLFLLTSLYALSQNLVPNPDFETFTSCPPNVNQGGPMECTPWFHPTDASSDYFNICGGSGADVPNNLFGTQNAHSGVAYAGIGVWFVGFLYREYLCVQLTQPLLPNTAYEVSWYVSLADNNCGTDKMGAYLSVNPTTTTGIVTLPYDPQVSSNLGLLTDKINWTLITGCFAAEGGEQYITIGNFFGNADTPLDPTCAQNPIQSYYYIDDVSVVAIGPPEILDVDLGDPVIACGSYVIDPNLSTSYHYHWEDGSIYPTLTVTQSGTYAVTISDGCAFGIDSVEVTVIAGQTVDIGPPTHQMCEGDNYVISLDPTLGTYTWQDGSHDTNYDITTAGTYSVTLDDGCFPTTDMVVVTTITPPPPNFLGNDTTLCPGDQIHYSFNPAGSTFLWQNGFNVSSYTITHSGLYALTITNICGVFTDNINVQYLQPFQIDLGPDYYLCPGDDFDINLDPTLGDFLWQDGSTSSSYNISSPGFYSVTVTNQCFSASSSVDIFASTEPVVDLGSDMVVCNNELPILLDLSNIPQATFIWQDGSTSDQFMITSGGTYSVTVSNPCYDVSDEITITINNPVTNVILPQDQFLCEGETFVITNSGETGTYQWQDNSTADTLLVDAPGVYTLTVTTSCGSGSDAVVINYIPPLPAPYLGPDLFLCSGGQLTLNPNIPGVNYLWQDGSTLNHFDVTAPGVYFVQISDQCSTTSDTVDVFLNNQPPQLSLPSQLSLCQGQSITLQAGISGVSYLWSDQSQADSLDVHTAGTYSLTISNACGTDADTVVVVDAGVAPTVALGADISVCAGDTNTLTPMATGVTNWLWNDGTMLPTVGISDSGIISVQVTNACGQAFDTLMVTLLPGPPVVDLAGQFNLCQGLSLSIEAGVSNVTYLWSDLSQADSLVVSTPGTYSLTVSNSCGMDADTVLIIDNGPPPTVALGNDVSVCPGDIMTITPVGTNVNSWLWNDGSTSPTYTSAGNELITVEVSNACGTAYDTLNSILLPATPPIDLGHDTSLCPGNTLQISINTPNVNIQWSDGSTNAQFQIDNPGHYYATISNLCGANSDTIDVNFLPAAPLLDLGIDQSLCPGEIITLDPGLTGVSYLWQDGSTSSVYNAIQAGEIILTVMNACGADIDSLDITISTNGPDVHLGPDILACEGDVVTLMSDISGVDFLWQDGSTDHDYLTSVSGTYILQVSNNCGVDADTVHVEINGTSPDTYLGADTVLCSGSSLLLSSMADAGTAIRWQDGSFLPTFLVNTPGTYILSESNHCGDHTDSVVVDFKNAPSPFDIGDDTILCPGQSIVLTAPQTNDEVVWQDGSSGTSVLADKEQIYSLTISNICGVESDQFSLSFDTYQPVIDLAPSSPLCPGDEIELNVTQSFPATYLWNTGSILPVLKVNSPGQYSVDVSTLCTDVHGETEVVTSDTCTAVNTFYIPNIFSPNGDNINDVFTIKFNNDIEVHSIQARIFDRWGNMVFQSDGISFEWNGEFGNKVVNPGVYVYRVELKYFDNLVERTVLLQGDVTLIK